MELMVFSKHLQGPPLAETARRLHAMGVDAIDLTVRPGGHVAPERVAEELPRAIADLASEGVHVGMLTTNILAADEPETEPILRAASANGIMYYKIGYYFYDGFGSLRKQRDEVRAKVRDLGQLNAEIGICGGYHNHSDNFIGASLWDIDSILEGTDPRYLGAYFDPAHAVVEGGSQGWLQGMDLLKDRIVMIAAKDFYWTDGKGYAGGRRNHVLFSPFSQGNVPWLKVLANLKAIGFAGPISLHSEYQGDHSFRDLTTLEVFEQTALDLKLFRDWMQSAV